MNIRRALKREVNKFKREGFVYYVKDIGLYILFVVCVIIFDTCVMVYETYFKIKKWKAEHARRKTT